MHRTVIVDPVSNMAAAGCVLHRTLTRSRSRSGPKQESSSSPAVCRDFLSVVDLQRYSRDQGSSVYFPQAVLSGEDLYDVTLTDGDCRLQVTLDPGLNRLVERNVLRPGSTLRNATFALAMSAQHPACPGASAETDSYRLERAEVRGDDEDDGVRRFDVDVDSLPWFGSSDAAGPLVPLRANRSVFLPQWNNVDYSGEVWREAPPTEEEAEHGDDEEEEEEGRRPAVTVSELRDHFLSGHRGVARGAVQHRLIIRIINKSHLMYYGRTDRNCECPYKAVLEVCDRTGGVCVVLWNSVCVDWYHHLKPGDVISLRRYRVKRHYQAELDDIEISVNSRNPAAQISVLPESSVSPEYLPPAPTYSFYNSKDLLDLPHSAECDVIGLLTFTGRAERIRSKDGRGAELLEYRWLRLEDGTSDQPIHVKLFSTSQPETHRNLHPLSVVVCTRLKLIKSANQSHSGCFLTNTINTQVYCTGLGHHSEMSYRKLRPVRQFLQWLRSQDDGQVLSRALIGGFFMYPPPPVSLETYMKDRRGEPGFLRGAELQRELEKLCYRERRTFCIQAKVTMVAYGRRGEEDRSLLWTDRAASRSSSLSSPRRLTISSHPSPSPSLSFTSSLQPLPSSPHSFRPPLSPSSSSLSPSSPSSALSQLAPRPVDLRAARSCKRKLLLHPETPKRRHPWVTLQPEQNDNTVILFEASMEFLENPNADEDEDDSDEDGASSFVTAPLFPDFPSVAEETLPMRYDHASRKEQAVVVAMGGRADPGRFDPAFDDYYTLRLRALSDSVSVDVVFLPHSSPPVLPHPNTWTSILSHGAFSSHGPPPSPADLIVLASQLTNQRLVCVLEACHLGGTRTELILSRAFQLPN
ncbi:LOW QUALITY PROTEIN: RPA-related protein RADX [Pleuronectes platessa]|uniref:LOW QUALITY PROTEIN: RPA-related protein RADX n=1 Tax=Pleuronectes platessa TaxID=8262 RepID=UPI00232A41EB|nr:LOW QUALITY PROTEIN: RPA-related protein RADX [Pleuronectes platessa]